MHAQSILKRVRQRAQRSLREAAAAAGTSHATLSSYEHGRVDPGSATLLRIVRANGLTIEPTLLAAPDPESRAVELVDVLELAEQFPARHDRHLVAPVFPRG